MVELETVDEQIQDTLKTGREVGLHTLKACCQDKYRSEVEPAITAMVAAGFVMEVKKHRYVRIVNGKH